MSRRNADTARLEAKVVTGADTDAIVGWLGRRLKVRVSAPPSKGKANTAVVTLLTRRLGLPPGAVRVTAGRVGTIKRIGIAGIGQDELNERIDTHLHT